MMQAIYISILLHVLFGLSDCWGCPQKPLCEPLCDCRPNTGMFDVYCANLTTLEPVITLLRDQFYNCTINKLMFMKDCNLITLPNHAFDNLSISIFLTSCPFTDIPADAFHGTRGLTKIDMQNTSFATIPTGLLNLEKLKTLNLKYNNLTSLNHELWNLSSLLYVSFIDGGLEDISEDVFVMTPDIQYLDLSYNRLRYVHPDTFKPLVSLQRIYIRGNQISSADGLFKHINPEVIDLYDNNLTSLDNVFRMDMWRLTSLNVGKNPINYINSSSFNSMFRNLDTFDMSATKCTEMDPQLFHSFPKLKQALLSRNKLQNIPRTLFHNLQSLEVIDLTSNSITSIEGLFHNIKQMKKLLLGRNRISKIGNAFRSPDRMNKLEKLYIGENEIERICDNDFEGVPGLKSLILSSNYIESIESKSFSRLQNLSVLELSSNHFVSLNRSLQNLFSLRELSVRSVTSLEKVDHDEFLGLTKLSILNLVNDRIRSLNGVFRDLRSLRNLNIAKNKLTTLSRDTFPEEIKLEMFWLASGNKLECDCRLTWMINWLKQVNYTVLKDNPLCHLPLRLRGKPIKALTIEDITMWPEDCPVSCRCECVDQGWKFYVKADCSDRNLKHIPDILPQNLGDLDLSDNRLESVSNICHNLTSGLIYLNLEQNQIKTLQSEIPDCLEELRLAGNFLNRFPWTDLANDTFDVLTLADNPWICDCETVNFRKWLLSVGNTVVDVNETRCGHVGPFPKLYGKVITALKDTDLCPSVISLYISLAIGLLCSLLMGTSMVLAYSRYHLHIKVWLYAHGYTWVKEDDLDTEKPFDALVSYHRKEEDFIFGEIAPRLEEEEPKFTLCIPQRDFVCGEFEVATQMKAIKDSKRVIVILTQDYMNDAFCMSIFQQAFEQSLEDKVHRVILINLGDLSKSEDMNSELRVTLDSTSCISRGERLFWERLRYAMPKKNSNKQTAENDYTDSVDTETLADPDNDSDVTPLLP